MGKIKISENLFLEKAELQRFQRFIADLGWQRAMRAMVSQWGVVQNAEGTSFRVVPHPSLTGHVLVYPGLAYTPQAEAIVLDTATAVSLGSGTDRKWIVISRVESSLEQGTVSITADGVLTGVGTKFTEVLRGQPYFPTKIRFEGNGNQNTYEYEVVSVTDDGNAILSGSFIPQSGLRYAVVGAFTPGFVPSSENRNIYAYDACRIVVIPSETVPAVEDGEYIIAYADYDINAAVTISDYRVNCMLKVGACNSRSEEQNNPQGLNPCVSLLAVDRIGGTLFKDKSAELELLVEFAFFITGYAFSVLGDGTYLSITERQCNAMQQLPDGVFNGFLLVNRNNMKSVRIVSQQGSVLKLDAVDITDLVGDEAAFVIVPDFARIQITATASDNVDMPSVPFTWDGDVRDGRCRVRMSLQYPYQDEQLASAVDVALRYRVYNEERSGEAHNFNSATYQDNIRGLELICAGSINIPLQEIQPVEHMDNYS